MLCFPLHHGGSRRFGGVEPPQIHSVPCRPASPFGEVEPPQTHSNLPYRPASPSNSTDHSAPTLLAYREGLGWFNYTEPLRTTVMKGEAGLLGGFE